MEKVNLILTNSLFQKEILTLEELEKNRKYCKHDLTHFLTVARLMQIKNLQEQLKIKENIIYACGLLHDIQKYELNHGLASAKLAKEILINCHYNLAEIREITLAIEEHNQDYSSTILSSLLKEADHLSRNCFCCTAADTCYWKDEQRNRGIKR